MLPEINISGSMVLGTREHHHQGSPRFDVSISWSPQTDWAEYIIKTIVESSCRECHVVSFASHMTRKSMGIDVCSTCQFPHWYPWEVQFLVAQTFFRFSLSLYILLVKSVLLATVFEVIWAFYKTYDFCCLIMSLKLAAITLIL